MSPNPNPNPNPNHSPSPSPNQVREGGVPAVLAAILAHLRSVEVLRGRHLGAIGEQEARGEAERVEHGYQVRVRVRVRVGVRVSTATR